MPERGSPAKKTKIRGRHGQREKWKRGDVDRYRRKEEEVVKRSLTEWTNKMLAWISKI